MRENDTAFKRSSSHRINNLFNSIEICLFFSMAIGRHKCFARLWNEKFMECVINIVPVTKCCWKKKNNVIFFC